MHRYRLRYIVFGLLIYIQSAFCRTSCGSDFDDVASRTVLAGVVFEGTLKELYETYSPHGYNATFRVRGVLKGDLPREEGQNTYKVILVGIFGQGQFRDCGQPASGVRYLIFLQGKSGSSLDPSVPFYQMSAFPIHSNRTSKREVRKHKCANCARRPKARVIPQFGTDVKVGEKFELKCKPSGQPKPRIAWYKDRQLISEDDSHYKIKGYKKKSRLRVKKATKEDDGVYMCEVINVMGRDYKEARVSVEDPGDGSIPENTRPCAERNYCLNGGQCYEFLQLGTKFCECKTGFTGHRCRDQDLFDVISGAESHQAKDLDRALTIAGLCITALVLAVIFIASYFMAKNKREKFRKKQEKKQMQNDMSNGNYRPIHLDNGPVTTLDKVPDIKTKSKTHSSACQTDDYFPPPVEMRMHEEQDQPQQHRHSGHSARHHSGPLPRQNTAPALLIPPRRPSRERLSATSVTPEFDFCRRSKGPESNIAVVAVVESDPEHSRRNSPSMHSRHEPPIPPPDYTPNPMFSVCKVPLKGTEGELGSREDSLDLDQKSDYDNQQSSDLEVNLESEVDICGLDASGDEVDGQPQGVTRDSGSSDLESDMSSAGEEEQALFQRLQQNGSPQRPTSGANNANFGEQNNTNHLPWGGIINHQPKTPNTDHYAFNKPYAYDDDDSQIIPNKYFHHPGSQSSNQYGLPEQYAQPDDEAEYPYDPDPDATVV